MALLIIILTPVTILRTPVDIFPEINIPVVSVVWNYDGLSPQEMADRIVSNSEPFHGHGQRHRASGIAVVVWESCDQDFLPATVNISMALTQVTAMCQTVLRGLPAGRSRRCDYVYGIVDAGGATGHKQQDASGAAAVRSVAEFLRTQLSTVQARDSVSVWRQTAPGAGGLDSAKLQAYGLSPADIVNAVSART